MRTSAELRPDTAEGGHLYFMSAEGKGEEEMKWISVDDRLPEKDCYVLTYNGKHKYPSIKVCRYYSIDESFSNPWKQSYITHWQPLPDPPQEKNK